MRICLLILAAGLALTLGCGPSSDPPAESGTTTTADPSGLSGDELENGIGPVKAPVELGALDPALAAKGQLIFEQKCLSCHKLGERFIGPALGDVLSRRTPRYVLNMILNPDEMVKRHPEAKKLLAEYLAPMAQQNLSPDDARAVLEYIRSAGSTGTASPAGR
ncbi:MAG: cytochrome c [Candidatus Delongbacteria bacterium]